jgi:hypothetical protein
METLIQRILRKEKKSHIEKTLNDEEIEPFFQAHGIDIDTIGFPDMQYRKSAPTEAYWIHFRDVILTPVKVDGVVKTVITGKYETKAQASYRDRAGDWHPGTPCKYSFRIEDGNLSLRRT